MTPPMCWLHSADKEHPVTLLVGFRLPDTIPSVVPADLKCARPYGIDLMRPATEINVEREAS